MEARELLSRQLFDGLLSLLQPTVVCDIGAFNGDESRRFARVCPAARVVAFEANEDNIDAYWNGSADWPEGERISWQHMAVAAHTGTVTFNILDAAAAQPAWRRSELPWRRPVMTLRTLVPSSAQADVVISPATTATPVFTSVSQATRARLSCAMMASRIASEI